MKIDRELYKEYYELNFFPEWHCPECNAGKLSVPENGVKSFEYPSSLKLHKDNAWEPEWMRGCFTGVLNCTNNKCKGKTVFSGDTFYDQVVEDLDEEPYHRMVSAEHMIPKYFNPPLEIIQIPDYLPDQIADCLRESFKLFWADNSACANKIRIAVEVIMNDQGIPKSFLTNKRKRESYKLHRRIEIFQRKNNEVGELLFAIKWIGNEGSHGLNILTRENIIIAFEILHQCIEKIYNKRPGELLKIAKNLNKNKGVLKK